mgnify:CR=1 FL=1
MTDPLLDKRSLKNLETLLPQVRPLALALVKAAAEKGISIQIISGTRTYAEQDALYAQGRNGNPGQIVTRARGGYSNHNFGLAFDCGLFEGKKYIEESPSYKIVGQLGKALGLSWGGDWKFADEPHFEYNPERYTTAQLRQRTADGLPLL